MDNTNKKKATAKKTPPKNTTAQELTADRINSEQDDYNDFHEWLKSSEQAQTALAIKRQIEDFFDDHPPVEFFAKVSKFLLLASKSDLVQMEIANPQNNYVTIGNDMIDFFLTACSLLEEDAEEFPE